MPDLEFSTFQKLPAYRYIRTSDKLPTIDAVRHLSGDELFAKVKLFSGGWTWYIAAYDPETRLAYALVDGQEMEAGDVSMEELVALRMPPFRLPIERDLHWTPKSFAELRAARARSLR